MGDAEVPGNEQAVSIRSGTVMSHLARIEHEDYKRKGAGLMSRMSVIGVTQLSQVRLLSSTAMNVLRTSPPKTALRPRPSLSSCPPRQPGTSSRPPRRRPHAPSDCEPLFLHGTGYTPSCLQLPDNRETGPRRAAAFAQAASRHYARCCPITGVIAQRNRNPTGPVDTPETLRP